MIVAPAPLLHCHGDPHPSRERTTEVYADNAEACVGRGRAALSSLGNGGVGFMGVKHTRDGYLRASLTYCHHLNAYLGNYII